MKIMLKKVLISLLLIFITPLFAFAQSAFRVAPSGKVGIVNIPFEVQQIIPQKDLVEVVCYETKWRGKEVIEKVEAVNQALQSLLEEVRQLGIEINPSLFVVSSSIIEELERKIEAVCQAPDLTQAQARLQDFINTANSLRDEIQVKIAGEIRTTIEPALRAKGEEIKTKIEKELKAKAEKEAKEIEAMLRAQAQAEADQRKAEIKERLQKQIEAQLQAEFNARMDSEGNNSALIAEMLKKGPELGAKLEAKEGEKIRAELEAKYQKLAEEEREKLCEKYEKKAKKIAGEEKRKMEEIAKKFENFGQNINAAIAQVGTSKYQEYRQKALEKKKEIIAKAVDYYIKQAKKEIEKQGPLIEKARQEGRCGASYNGVRLPCQVEDLLTQLEQDKRLIIQQLTIQGTDQKTINELRKTFKEKWENIRRSLELAKLRSGVEIYQTIAKRVDWDYMASKLKKSFNHLNSTISSYEKSRNVCQKIHPSKKNWRQCVSLYFGGKSE